MMMGVQYGIDFVDVVTQTLLPEIGRSIYQNRMTVLPDQNR